MSVTEVPIVPVIVGLFLLGFAIAFVRGFLLPALKLDRTLDVINARLDAERADGRTDLTSCFSDDPKIFSIWKEFKETLHVQRELDPATGEMNEKAVRSTVPAEAYLSPHAVVDARVHTEFFKHLPGIFTGIGIIGTFSGLLTGLRTFQISEDSGVVRNSLTSLLHGVSEAFFVSASAILLAMLATVVEKFLLNRLYGNLRGSNNLVFGGSRRTVEALADRLRQRCERARVPEEFFPHHGSLSKELRETLETRLKEGVLPTTAVATTTLELGIDLGSVTSVAQIGAPRSMAGLKQRLGRSGRRGKPAVLRIYVREKHLAADADQLDRLRLDTARAVACVRLLQENWVESARSDPSLATVVLHQTLSLIASGGAVKPGPAHKALAGPDSFIEMAPGDYADLLRCAARPGVDLLEQSSQGLLMLGEAGERLVTGRDFYAVFSTDQEWRLVVGGRTIGTVPIVNVLGVGSLVGFAGRRWRVEAVDDRAKVLEVVQHRAGKLPRFNRPASEALDDKLVATIRAVLGDDGRPAYLDPAALEFLDQGRAAYRELGLDHRTLVPAGGDTHLVTWAGTAVNGLLAILLTSAGLEAEVHDVGITAVDTSPAELTAVLCGLEGCPPVEDLASFVEGLRTAKLDDFVDEDLLRRLWAVRHAKHRDRVTAVLRQITETRLA